MNVKNVHVPLDGSELGGEVVPDPIGVASGLRAYLDQHPAGLVPVTTHARRGPRQLLGATAAGIAHALVAPVRL